MTKKDAAVYQGDKATVVKHADNLKVEGKFEGRTRDASVTRGELMSILSHKDNLNINIKF